MMKKWILRFLYVALVMGPVAAIADYTATTGTGSTVFAFVCSSTKICPATVLMDSTNVEKATAGNPLRVDPTGTTTQPVSAASLPLPAGAATAANQATEIAAINAPVPACAAAPCVTTIGDVGVDVSSGKGTPASVAINVSTATTTQLVAISGSTSIYVTSFDVIAGGTGNITFEYGTGSSCATGTTVLTGAYPLTAQAGIAKGSGVGTVLKVPSGNALCVLTSAAVQMSGSVSYQQF